MRALTNDNFLLNAQGTLSEQVERISVLCNWYRQVLLVINRKGWQQHHLLAHSVSIY